MVKILGFLFLIFFSLGTAFSQVTLEFNIPGCTKVGFDQIKPEDQKILLFPNPANKQFFLSVPSAGNDLLLSYDINNVIGQSVTTGIIQINQGEEHSVDVSRLENGIYLMVINAGQRVSYKKLIVNNK